MILSYRITQWYAIEDLEIQYGCYPSFYNSFHTWFYWIEAKCLLVLLGGGYPPPKGWLVGWLMVGLSRGGAPPLLAPTANSLYELAWFACCVCMSMEAGWALSAYGIVPRHTNTEYTSINRGLSIQKIGSYAGPRAEQKLGPSPEGELIKYLIS